ncbi:glutamyl-tRNA(Gln) amidotransferase subunit A, mitochondrial isoform X2 [Cherax quadricarinatus]|nr:glutamyl-tRNA(Gln) amidotransferase subunit A, mitochondrial-like isoform X2 [Cherax quadricarinatus]XP_053637129.1 glutamyl-tRNA(Gln) amidotransferase subunit A, mitochondrial-like isoform X2 [Cherax quadricarinatus]XP_053637216.1 glutamyl-tRNA(Gln) amidotransferase subunit A, mitochondrial-like isoform X2 [Cherax quadricarinatus]XP_053637287.1 glutamyl-tRNA(Gln) amidotransferase subunit A, mitochondrial-like isoform X2 [Cherax quadricarinatus]XP_053637353.1 glutamyl-tRNA(Gln) amidotransfer
MGMNYLSLSIRDVSSLLKQKTISSLELCNAALKRQNAVAKLHPFITHTPDLARESALHSQKRYDRGEQNLPLDGIPVAVKDNFCTSGIPTTCGSVMLQNYIPTYSATVVRRLQKAGAVIVGKTNLDEFGMGSGTTDSTFGPSKNIYRSGVEYNFLHPSREYDNILSRIPSTALENGDWYVTGGSSGGSALAVASGTTFLALGSDTGGSVRNPSSYCGVVGLKPSYGLVSRFGLISLVNSLDVPGLFGRYVDDVATMLSVVSGLDPQDSTSVSSDLQNLKLPENPSLDGLIIGIPREYHWPGMSKEIVDEWTKVADLMEDSGAQVREVSMPHTQYSIICYSVLNPCEVASNFTRYTGVGYGHRVSASHSMEAMYAFTRSSGLNEVVKGRILAGNYFLLRENKSKYFKQALKVRRLISEDFSKVWASGVNLLLTPVTLSTAIRYSEFQNLDNRTQTATQDICTQAANMAGVPAVSIPVSLNTEGLPVSLQLIGQWGKDPAMLSAAKWVEQNVKFPRINILE